MGMIKVCEGKNLLAGWTTCGCYQKRNDELDVFTDASMVLNHEGHVIGVGVGVFSYGLNIYIAVRCPSETDEDIDGADVPEMYAVFSAISALSRMHDIHQTVNIFTDNKNVMKMIEKKNNNEIVTTHNQMDNYWLSIQRMMPPLEFDVKIHYIPAHVYDLKLDEAKDDSEIMKKKMENIMKMKYLGNMIADRLACLGRLEHQINTFGIRTRIARELAKLKNREKKIFIGNDLEKNLVQIYTFLYNTIGDIKIGNAHFPNVRQAMPRTAGLPHVNNRGPVRERDRHSPNDTDPERADRAENWRSSSMTSTADLPPINNIGGIRERDQHTRYDIDPERADRAENWRSSSMTGTSGLSPVNNIEAMLERDRHSSLINNIGAMTERDRHSRYHIDPERADRAKNWRSSSMTGTTDLPPINNIEGMREGDQHSHYHSVPERAYRAENWRRRSSSMTGTADLPRFNNVGAMRGKNQHSRYDTDLERGDRAENLSNPSTPGKR